MNRVLAQRVPTRNERRTSGRPTDKKNRLRLFSLGEESEDESSYGASCRGSRPGAAATQLGCRILAAARLAHARSRSELRAAIRHADHQPSAAVRSGASFGSAAGHGWKVTAHQHHGTVDTGLGDRL